MTFREVRDEEYPFVESILKDIFGEKFILDKKSDLFKTFFLEDNSEIVGIIQFWYLFDEAEITILAIKKEFQGRGYGKILLEKTFEYLNVKGVKSVYLEVAIDNQPAKKLYEKLGFKFLTVREKYYADGKDAIVMKKDLKE
ncbi:ribosomal protein S18-alanine N-acetyltransferase [Sulfurihydrogenibium azorense]|jgi:ribosomal-protein-alanine N-acetyltransferase|uniref:ribosomal protein S18-alanine N-acetyltransferase n=1 Tax=Sulfurihydrogenibium azorense TaxID=309806 RepID=UPI00240A4DAE|nr:ribosomal protein S18-alanine N-acetyltransferase [Sulfurihydrogenibium azorense]MDM7274147.1 ribosomal protein S18-alanine N-acetyltransferase [Sulfurihydrogenibium azorense]